MKQEALVKKDKTGTTKIENDEYGRILSVTDGMGKTVEYEWGNMNERLATVYLDGKKAVYSYDEVGRLAGLETAKGMVSYSYDKRGNLVSVANGTDVIKSFVFDAANKMTESVGYFGNEEKKLLTAIMD